MERQTTRRVLYHIVLPVLNMKYSIVAKYFLEMYSMLANKLTHSERQSLYHCAIQFLEERGMNYLQKGAGYQKASGRSIQISPNQVDCILAYTNALIVIHCYTKAERNEKAGNACKNIFHLLFVLRYSSLQESFQHCKLHHKQTTKTPK